MVSSCAYCTGKRPEWSREMMRSGATLHVSLIIALYERVKCISESTQANTGLWRSSSSGTRTQQAQRSEGPAGETTCNDLQPQGAIHTSLFTEALWELGARALMVVHDLR